jgi:peptidyl-prolyl cis-trans isomerase A (cyclophilin A)
MLRPLLAAALLLTPAATLAQGKRTPGFVRVKISTTMGNIVVALDTKHAPKTAANFLAYADDERLDGTRFFRAARAGGVGPTGFIEGGVGTDYRRVLPPIPLERTDKTGIHHLDGTISMAREVNINSAMGNFSIMVGPAPSLDAHGSEPGYAAFGHVVSGMAVVKRILAAPTGDNGPNKGEMLVHPVRILTVRRLDGVAHPSNARKIWK